MDVRAFPLSKCVNLLLLQQKSEIRVIQKALGTIPNFHPNFVAVLMGKSEEIFFQGMFISSDYAQ